MWIDLISVPLNEGSDSTGPLGLVLLVLGAETFVWVALPAPFPPLVVAIGAVVPGSDLRGTGAGAGCAGAGFSPVPNFFCKGGMRFSTCQGAEGEG